jgi:endo-1,4-beta-xylanase
MRHAQLACSILSFVLARDVGAQPTPEQPLGAQFPPLIIEAESGAVGTDFTLVSAGDVTAVTVLPSPPNANFPGSAARVISFDVEFPAAGEYELYLRYRVGPGSGSDDSLFYGNGFGAKDPVSEADWVTTNGLSSVGYIAPEQVVRGGFALPLGDGYRWINLTEYNGGDAPVLFSVADGALAQTLQLGAREDGLEIDKLAFVAPDVSQTVSELDQGLAGHILPPPPPPRECIPRGPALAANQSKFLGGAYSGAQAPNFTAYFDQLTPENAGKWGSVENERDVMNWTGLDEAYELSRANGIPFKLHTLVWGNQQPTWMETLPSEEQRVEIEEWFASLAERYPDLDSIEVVNEPIHDPPSSPGSGGGNYIEALGGTGATGWDWVVTSFRLARQYFPSSELLINDYGIENSPPDVVRYKEIIALLQAEDLIDGIGLQGHAFSTRGSMDVIRTSLDSLAETGLPIYITELDIDGPTDEIQRADYQRIFPVFWQHPGVFGVTLWGYLPGHWRTSQGAFLALADGTERPALIWLREFLESPATTPVVRGQSFAVAANAAPGHVVGVVESLGEAPDTWLILGGSGEGHFELDPSSGTIVVSAGAVLDPATPEVTLAVVARDECTPTPVHIAIVPSPNAVPRVPVGQLLELDADLVTADRVRAVDDDGDAFSFSVVGGSGAGVLSVDAASGAVQVVSQPSFDVGAHTLLVVASDGSGSSAPTLVTVALPERVRLCLAGHTVLVARPWVPLALLVGAELGACDTAPAVRGAEPAASTPDELD